MAQDRNFNKRYDRAFITTLVMIIALISFVPMLLISVLILDQFDLSHNEKLYAHLKEVVHKHTLDIDSFLNERLNNIQFLSDSCGFENLLNESVLQEELFLLQQTYGDVFEDLGIINQAGVQEFYAGQLKLEKAQYSHARWFAEALENDNYISDVFLGLRTTPHFIVSVKRTYQGRNFLLRATINFDAFNSLAENLRIGKTGFAFILNKKGEFQTKPHYDMLPSKKSYPDFLKAGKKTKHGTYIGTLKDASGREEIIYVAALLKNEDWILVYQQEKSEAFADLIHAQITAGVIIFIGALLIVVMNLIVFQKVFKRIAGADREKEMMNRQVIETGKLASLGELAAGIAHEINNPVAIMVQEAGWIEDLLEEEEFEKGKNLEEFKSSLIQVKTQGKRCKEITHKLLSFARKTSPKIEKVQINEMIEEIVALSDMASYTKSSMHTYLDERLPPIYGSQTEIQQVFLNLINNALHALEKEGGKIDITSRREAYHVLVIVEDNGPGIPEANLDRIFDPFFTTKPVGKGSGLGLSICFGIIKKMGGEIDVHSIVDEGTRFEIRFPLKSPLNIKAEDSLLSTSAGVEVMARESENVLKKRIKLLLVDDEESFVKVLSKRLERRNIAVTTALSGTEGIQALRKVDFDVAVLDLKMEDMNGLEVLKIFKKMYFEMEVIILSGHESERAAREGMEYGACAYLAKPCNLEELINTIKKALS
jgi:two-component system NtrC family sensor kinase